MAINVNKLRQRFPRPSGTGETLLPAGLGDFPQSGTQIRVGHFPRLGLAATFPTLKVWAKGAGTGLANEVNEARCMC